jgi:hypothetical protein
MESGLILATPEIAGLVNPWLLATSENAQLGAPPLVTLLFPWLAAPVTETALDTVGAAHVRPGHADVSRRQTVARGGVVAAGTGVGRACDEATARWL